MYAGPQYIETANNLGAGRLRSIFTVVIAMVRGGIVLGFTFAPMLFPAPGS